MQMKVFLSFVYPKLSFIYSYFIIIIFAGQNIIKCLLISCIQKNFSFQKYYQFVFLLNNPQKNPNPNLIPHALELLKYFNYSQIH